MMFVVDKPGKRIIEVCNQLGKPYELKVIDGRNVIYRKFDDHEIEVGGLDDKIKEFQATVYIWDVSDYPRIVEKIKNIDSFEILKSTLESKFNQYSQTKG